jgi:chorismate dehydratase
MMVLGARIAAVSYLNTIPFIYGIQHEDNLRAELLLAPPAGCYENYATGKADIALMPSAMVPTLKSTNIITDYCIGSSGKVRTVMLFSNVPVGQVRRVFLDAHSRTSVQLIGYLAANLWKISPEWYDLQDYSQVAFAQREDAFLLIGDKVFDHEGLFNYAYDLSEEWNKLTHLPFAFAVWVARKGTSYELIDGLQRALTLGVESIWEAVVEHGFDKKHYNAYEYLTQNIDFIFNAEKHSALQKFWNAGLKVEPRSNPG